MIQRTLVVLKPDAVKRALAGKVLARLEDTGLKVVGARMTWMDDEMIRRHYDDLESRIGAEAFAVVVSYMASGPVIALAVEGFDAVAVVRKLAGPTFPSDAAPGTIRGDYAHHGRQGSKAVCNLVHASGTVEEAERELALWFGPGEIFDYSRLDEDYTL